MLLVEQKKINKKETIVVTSLDIAETFDKRHADVLRDIEHLHCSDDFTQRNFALSSYVDTSGKSNKCYLITRDGFTILAMGYNGEKAMKFKEAYIRQFNEMEQMLTARIIEREKGIVVRHAFTKALQESGENERMHNHAYSTYTDVIYKSVFGKNARQLREEYGIGKNENLRDMFSVEELAKVKSLEMVVSGLMNCGWGYEEIKGFVLEKSILKIAG